MNFNPGTTIIFLTLLSLAPIIFVLTTCFIKISMVLILTRESLGVQQIPPNIVIYGLSLILSFYIMGPVYNKSFLIIKNNINNNEVTAKSLVNSYSSSIEPLRTFLYLHSNINERTFFYNTLNKLWTKDMLVDVRKDDLLILIPAFMISEVTKAFRIGFLIYLPSIMIDIIVSNILMAMGMMMMSPVTISLPIKILLFISIDGWSRLVHLLLNSY